MDLQGLLEVVSVFLAVVLVISSCCQDIVILLPLLMPVSVHFGLEPLHAFVRSNHCLLAIRAKSGRVLLCIDYLVEVACHVEGCMLASSRCGVLVVVHLLVLIIGCQCERSLMKQSFA